MIESQDQEVLSEEIDKYAIIGTRDPDEAQELAAYHLAFSISYLGNKIVATGGAYGIDKKAMDGALSKLLRVYLPWDGYNHFIIPVGTRKIVYNPAIHTDWKNSVFSYHPNPNRLSGLSIALHARNFGIIFGCKVVIAFPRPDGSGGTGQGIRIANALNIPVIQANKGTIQDAPRWIGKTLQQLGFASKDIPITIQNRS